MSLSLMSPLYRFVIVISISMLFLGSGLSPAQAQRTSRNATFPVLGVSDLMVDITGNSENIRYGGCPFVPGAPSAATFLKAARAAAESAGDTMGCPMAKDSGGNYFWFPACAKVYDAYAETGSKGESSGPMKCCQFPPVKFAKAGVYTREDCLAGASIADTSANQLASNSLLKYSIPSDNPKVQTADQRKEIEDAAQKKKEARAACYKASRERIDSYFGGLEEVQCYKTIKGIIANWKSEKLFVLKDSLSRDTTTATSGSIWTIVANLAKVVIRNAAVLIQIATDADKLFNKLNNGCGGVIKGLNELQSFRNSVVDQFSCQGITNLIERQLTQCIRGSLTLDLNLPRFSLLLQCPVNFNLDIAYTVGGNFKCYSSMSVDSPITANFGSASLMKGDGSIADIFDGDCFSKPEETPNSTPSSARNEMGGANGSRIPGIDCGPLDSSAAKRSALTGTKALTAGTPVASGWVVGGTDKVVSGSSSFDITRCDFYQAKRIVRTNYVFGSGASCNTGVNGFLDGNYETNTACYGSGYTPKVPANSNVPDACMYNPACLDSNGTFDRNLLGVGSCPAGEQPLFNGTRSYAVFTSGGLDGGQKVFEPCTNFTPEGEPAYVQCCDPQMQNCANRDVNVPLCLCDEGDAKNFVSNTATGQCDKGGNATCCSPRLNGEGWCEANNLPICADELANQCIEAGEGIDYTDLNGNTVKYPAGNLALNKPSPFIYLFVRPDVDTGNTQCCTTEWCNVCPQHYANAYGLSMIQSTQKQATSEAGNNALLGKGWPFVATTSADGITNYQVGGNSIVVKVLNPLNQDSPFQATIRYPTLYIGNDIEYKPSDTMMRDCNNLSDWKAAYAGDQEFTGGEMGFKFPSWKKNEGMIGYAQFPTLKETPLAYLNRIRQSFTSGGVPLPEIPLCSAALNFCTPNATNNGSSNRQARSVATPPPVVVPTASPAAAQPAPSVASDTAAPAPAAATSSGGATQVPSVSGGQASGSLY